MAEATFQREYRRRRERERSAHAGDTPAHPQPSSSELSARYLATPCFALGKTVSERVTAMPLVPRAGPPARVDQAEPILRDPGPGSPLRPGLRETLEQRFGRDLGHIRVHTGPRADVAANALKAAAFTHGHHIFLRASTQADDKRTMAHEIAHVAQQGAAPPLRLAARAPRRAALPPAPRAAPASARAGAAGGVQRIDLWSAARRVGRGVVSGVRAVGGAVAELGADLLAQGRDAVFAAIRRVAPGFLPLFQGDGIRGFLSRLINRGVRSLFDGLLGPLRGMFNFDAMGARVTQAVAWLSSIAGQLANNDCSGVIAAGRQISAFFGRALGPVIDRITSIASSVKGFFSSIWEAIGAPVVEILRNIGGEIWQSLRGFVRDVGSVIRRVRSALGSAWTTVKGWLGIGAEEGTDEGGGLWNWIKGKAAEIGESISSVIRPAMGHLRGVGGVLLLIVPGGQLIGIMQLWPQLQRAYGWLSQRWSDLNLIPRARAFMVNTVLPALMNAAETVGQAVLAGADWLLGQLNNLAGVLAAAASSAVGVLSPLRALISFAREKFSQMITWAQGGLRYASRNFRSLMRRLIEFMGVVLDALRRLMAIVVNPFGIVGFLQGTLWRLIPECLKGPIIDFIIDILLRLVRAMPAIPQLGILWPLIKAAMIGFFQRVKSGFSTARKVAVSNKIARIVSGMSPSFAFGYLRGLVTGVFQGIIAPFQAIALIFELPSRVQTFLQNLGVRFCEIIEQIRCFAANLAGRVFGTLDDVLGALGELLEDPSRILDLIRCAIEGALSAAEGIGEQIANGLMEILESAEESIGQRLGELTGSFLVQAVIAYFTAGAGAAVGVAGQIARALGTVGRAIGQVLRTVTQLFGRLVSFLRGLASRFASAAAGGARSVLGRLGAWFRSVAAWFGRLLRRVVRFFRRRFGLSAAQRAQWLAFRGSVASLTASYVSGVRRRTLATAYRGVLNRYRSVAKRPAFITKHGPHWRLWVRRVKGIRPRKVGETLLDRSTRWRQGRKEVRSTIRRLKRRPGLVGSAEIRAALPRIKTKYRYTALDVRFDSTRNDFNVTGAMSPNGSVTRSAPERPKENRVRVVAGQRHVMVNPLVKRSATRSPPWGTPTEWPEIEKIKTRSGRSTLYIKGHIVSGHFADGNTSNLTPITRSANGLMATQAETPVRRQLPLIARGSSRKPIFKYSVRASGRAARRPPKRTIRAENDACRRVPEEKELKRTITITINKYGFNDSTKKWDRDMPAPSPAPINNVPDYPAGYQDC